MLDLFDVNSCKNSSQSQKSLDILTSHQPCQSLFVAPCSHVWHYKCIRPIINDERNFPQFMCPNCRAVTDLEADVDDPAEDELEDEELSPELTSARELNDEVMEQGQQALNGDDESLSQSASRLLAIRDRSQLTPLSAPAPDPLNGSHTAPDLLSRRGARQISPPFAPVGESSAINIPSNQAQYLRPITPTRPLLGDDELNDSAMRTPSMSDHFAQDGPMTPTNNAGPFVFDGSAGRVVERTDAGSMTENGEASSEA